MDGLPDSVFSTDRFGLETVKKAVHSCKASIKSLSATACRECSFWNLEKGSPQESRQVSRVQFNKVIFN